MIIEGLVSTGTFNSPHLAAMGGITDEQFSTLQLRPFPTTQTLANLQANPQGVFHVTDNAILIAQLALGLPHEPLEWQQSEQVTPPRMATACRVIEFQVDSIKFVKERTLCHCSVLKITEIRPFLGFNRARHSLIELAITLTRLFLMRRPEVEDQFRSTRTIIEKTGTESELQFLAVLEQYFQDYPGEMLP